MTLCPPIDPPPQGLSDMLFVGQSVTSDMIDEIRELERENFKLREDARTQQAYWIAKAYQECMVGPNATLCGERSESELAKGSESTGE